MAASLAEPVVLAAAKEALYPEVDHQSDRYAVTDTQFSVSNWGGWEVPPTVHERLRPFNAIRLNSGAPDLFAVGRPDIEVLNASAASSIVVAVEAKGHNTSPDQADVSLGIEQAYARLPEVNLGFVAAPTASVDDTSRSLARELNIGVLGVDEDHRVSLLEPARVTGAGEFSTGLEAVRFQVRTHRLTEGSFPVNHPKNFLGYAIAVAADAETDAIYARKVIREVSGGRRGAILLGLVEPSGGDDQLTALGAEVVRFAIQRHGSLESALDTFDEWTGRSTRFTELAPRWAQLARSVTMQYDPTRLIVKALERLHRDDIRSVTLPQLFERTCELNLPLAVEVFITRDKREAVLTEDGELEVSALGDDSVYKSGVYFQYKAQLYHVGLITSGGQDDAEVAVTDEWRLEEPVTGPNNEY